MLSLSDVNLAQQRVMIRLDLNVPIQNGDITDDSRLRAALPTIQQALAANAGVILLSHLGRPSEGGFDGEFSLAPVATWLTQALKQPVHCARDWLNNLAVAPGQVILCENVRFNSGEIANDPALAKQLASLCDVFVMDAFATAHRVHASTVGVIEQAKIACAGPLLEAELAALANIMQAPVSPVVAIVGGAKISTKLVVLENLLDRVDVLIPGGGITNTLLAASGYTIGQSLFEADLLDNAKLLLQQARDKQVDLALPTDVVVATELSPAAQAKTVAIDAISEQEAIFDIGEQTRQHYAALIQQANTVLWNGPVGVFEIAAFAEGTKAITHSVADSDAFSVAGGGDTLAAITQFGASGKLSYISTGGGAFLEAIEAKTLPAIAALTAKSKPTLQAKQR